MTTVTIDNDQLCIDTDDSAWRLRREHVLGARIERDLAGNGWLCIKTVNAQISSRCEQREVIGTIRAWMKGPVAP